MPQRRLDPAQIRDAAQALFDEGRSPTLIAVRNRLGGGSPRSIAPVLAHWVTEQAGKTQPPADGARERAELLDEISRQDERIEALLAALGASEQATRSGFSLTASRTTDGRLGAPEVARPVRNGQGAVGNANPRPLVTDPGPLWTEQADRVPVPPIRG